MKKYGIFDEYILQSDRTGQMKCGGRGGAFSSSMKLVNMKVIPCEGAHEGLYMQISKDNSALAIVYKYRTKDKVKKVVLRP